MYYNDIFNININESSQLRLGVHVILQTKQRNIKAMRRLKNYLKKMKI